MNLAEFFPRGPLGTPLILLLCSVATLDPQCATGATSFDVLRQRAADMATRRYQPEVGEKLPKSLENLNYDQYQQVRFRPEFSPWAKEQLRFDLQFSPRGYLFRDAVKLNLLLPGNQEQEISFSPAMFDPGTLKIEFPNNQDLGFAGFKIFFRHEPRAGWEEVASFLGASYFRLVGQGLRYGTSTRALAIDTGEPAGEEFPRLIEFWLQRPESLASHVVVLGLLDSPSVTGACRFLINVASETTAEVELSLFPRSKGKKMGIAPLTSMFLIGENRTRHVADFRPEVHDSDGLLVTTAEGERLWRALENPEKTHRISRFEVNGLKGFGLMQRDRAFPNYEDLVARYDLRPGFWVKPLDDWGQGTVELVEIPSPNEYNDNIVAYWIPAQVPAAGNELRFRYRLTALREEPPDSLLKVTATRIAAGERGGLRRFVLDFAGATMDSLAQQGSMKPNFNSTGFEVKNPHIQYNEVTGGWRLSFDCREVAGDTKELRVFLGSTAKPLSEIWVFHGHK